MARAVFVKSAQKDIYENGKYVKYTSKKGKRSGQELSKLDRTVPKDKNDKIFIAKGESYYHWSFLKGGKHFSKTAPRRSQLTQSGFLSSLYDLQDNISAFGANNKEEFDGFKEECLSEIENMKDECQNSLDNMPESLQSAPTGELLQERIDALDNWYSEIESIECEYDEEEIREEKKSEFEKEEGESDDDYNDRIESEVAEAIEQIVNDAIEELNGTDCGL